VRLGLVWEREPELALVQGLEPGLVREPEQAPGLVLELVPHNRQQ